MLFGTPIDLCNNKKKIFTILFGILVSNEKPLKGLEPIPIKSFGITTSLISFWPFIVLEHIQKEKLHHLFCNILELKYL